MKYILLSLTLVVVAAKAEDKDDNTSSDVIVDLPYFPNSHLLATLDKPDNKHTTIHIPPPLASYIPPPQSSMKLSNSTSERLTNIKPTPMFLINSRSPRIKPQIGRSYLPPQYYSPGEPLPASPTPSTPSRKNEYHQEVFAKLQTQQYLPPERNTTEKYLPPKTTINISNPEDYHYEGYDFSNKYIPPAKELVSNDIHSSEVEQGNGYLDADGYHY
ncbi:uncharacterized protein LOC142233360 [Haematobia irritans]|uniref:uncharacterized protein LOC142233360 n=1 Tax=Haematobia irritans TaxID=7368 RepID=UPI003F501327